MATLLTCLATVSTVQILSTADPAHAAGGTTSLTNEGFTNAATADANWRLPSSATNTACLTAGTDTAQTPIPACSTTRIDPVGNGSLRLTTNAGNKVGTVYNSTSLPTSQGLDVQFNSYQWNTTSNPGADGISFILAATNPTNPAPPTVTGPLGGALGYSTNQSASGVSNGYLGFGLDVFGNFRNSAYGGNDCAANTASPQNVTVRGPGNALKGYCIARTATVSTGTLDSRTATTRPVSVPVEIAINPSAAAVMSNGGVSVPARSWMMAWTPVGGSKQSMSAALPTAATLAAYNFPASYYDPISGLPYQLTFGWAASTGGSNEIHEVNTLTTTTLSGQLPVLNVAVTDNQSGHLLAGSSDVVKVTPSLDAGQGDETQPVTVTTNFPAGITPSNPSTTDYSCSTAGQSVSCVYTPPGGTVPAGTSFPTLAIPVVISAGASGTITVTAKASSTDANPARTTYATTVTPFGATASPASASYGSSVTLTATGLSGNATGTVTFASGGTTLCTATLPSLACTTSTALAKGSYPVTASYSGDANYSSSTASTSFTITKAATTLSAGRSDASVPYGTSDTLTFSGLPAGATGSVSFTSGSTTLCTVADVTAASSCSTPSTLVAGSYPVTATYSGDGNTTGSTATTSFVVTKSATSLSAGRSDASVPFGTSDTLTFSGLPPAATGSVTFTSGATTLCSVSDVAVTSSCSTPTNLVVGNYPVTATYSGDSNWSPSSATTSFDVSQAATSLATAPSDPSVTYGSPDTLSFSGLPGDATGSVTFTSGSTTLCTVSDVTAATSCSTPAGLDAATYPVTATYSGDANHTGSTATTSFTVTRGGSTGLTAGVSDASVSYGSPDTVSFSGLPAGATGSMTFTSGATTLCAVADVTAASSCSTPAGLGVGTYPVTATYSGDGNHDSSTASTMFAVAKASTTLSAAPSDPSVVFGTSDTLSFSGLPGDATGSVTFTSGATTLCTVSDVATATSCVTPAGLGAGTYPVTATYGGDANHEGSTASTSFVVTPTGSSGLTAGVSDASVSYGSTDTLSFSGLPAGVTGSVTFTSGATVLCTVDDITAASSCITSTTLPVRSYPVTATYSGDGNHTSSTAPTTFAVTKAATTLSAAPSDPSVPHGAADTLSFSGLPTDATGSVTFTSASTVLCSISDVTAASSCSAPSNLAAGTYPVSVAYSGDANHTGSTTATSFDVVKAAVDLAAGVSDSSVVFGSSDTVSFSGLPADATGSVTFTSRSTTLCTVADISAASSCSTPAGLGAGSYPVTATYSGDGNYTATSAATSFAVTRGGSAGLTAGVSDPSVSYGSPDTLSFSGLPAGATGAVTFTSGSTALCTVADISTATSCSTPAGLDAGTYPVAATYSGDANHDGSVAATTFDVMKAATTLSAAPSDPSVVYGSSDTLSFSGLPAGATGSLTFTSGSTVLCTVNDITTATSCTASAGLGAGTYPVTATYSGDANYAGTATETTFEVTKAPAALFGINAGRPSVAFGTSNTLTFSGLPTGATGSVTFTSGASTLCTIADISVTSTCPSGVLDIGLHPVTGTYSGDANHSVARAVTSFTVDRSATGVIASVTVAVISYGTADTLSFSGLPVGATGSVVFTSDGTTVCTVADVTAATSCTTGADRAAGRYPVAAIYSGDGRYLASTDSTGFVVRPATTSMSASASPALVGYGHADTLAVGGLPPGATGVVTFTSGGVTLCTTDVGHSPSCPTSVQLPVGAYPVTATYAGDQNYASATAQTDFVVKKSAPAGFAATATPARVSYGSTDTLSAGGLPAGATGTVTFTYGSTTLCTVTLASGTSCRTRATLPVGSYPVTASYSGDANNTPATTTTLFVVEKAPTEIAAGPLASTVQQGTRPTFTVAGLPADAAGTVVFSSNSVVLCTVTLPGKTCQSSLSLPVGLDAITASYSGDANHAPSAFDFQLTVVGMPVNASNRGPTGLPGTGADIEPGLLNAGLLLFIGLTLAYFGRRRVGRT